jgi:hypothetical protein
MNGTDSRHPAQEAKRGTGAIEGPSEPAAPDHPNSGRRVP